MSKRCVRSVLEMVGDTPLLELDGFYVKCEFMNPSGSIKARMAMYIVEKAEQEGMLKPGDTIVEATSGNTGNALAMIGAVKGYSVLVLIPEGYSNEKLAISRAYGAEVRIIGSHQVDEALTMAKELGAQEGYWCPLQFENEWNIDENMEWLGGEILDQLPDSVTIDAVVQGVGTGGTLIGVGRALRDQHNADLKLFVVEPVECSTISTGLVGDHMIEGIADGFVPLIIERNMDQIDDFITVTSEQAITEIKRLSTKHGLLVGPSSGANVVAVKEVRRRYPAIGNVLTFFCDEGEKSLSLHYGA